MEKPENTKKEGDRKNPLAIVGSVLGLIALAMAFLSPWIAEAIDPPSKPVEESITDLAVKIKQAAAAKLKGEEYKGEVREKVPSDFLPPIVIGLGIISVGFGVGSFFSGEEKRFAGCAAALGLSAAVVQLSIILVSIIICLIILMIVLNALGLDLSSI